MQNEIRKNGVKITQITKKLYIQQEKQNEDKKL